MADRDIESEAKVMNQATIELDTSKEDEDDRWSAKPGMTAREVIAIMHLRPGEAAPAWFEPCEVCLGARCHECDDTGRMHPWRAQAWEDYLINTLEPDVAGRLRHPRTLERQIEKARAGELRCSDVADGSRSDRVQRRPMRHASRHAPEVATVHDRPHAPEARTRPGNRRGSDEEQRAPFLARMRELTASGGGASDPSMTILICGSCELPVPTDDRLCPGCGCTRRRLVTREEARGRR